jgi:hypothetical protein
MQNTELIQILGGVVGILIGCMLVVATQWSVFYFSRDERWYRKNRREWKQYYKDQAKRHAKH